MTLHERCNAIKREISTTEKSNKGNNSVSASASTGGNSSCSSVASSASSTDYSASSNSTFTKPQQTLHEHQKRQLRHHLPCGTDVNTSKDESYNNNMLTSKSNRNKTPSGRN